MCIAEYFSSFKLPEPEPPAENGWCVYLVRCGNGSFYCGVSNRPRQRFAAHVAGKGAKYLRMHKPLAMKLVYEGVSRGQALRAEASVKRLDAAQKRRLWAALADFQTA